MTAAEDVATAADAEYPSENLIDVGLLELMKEERGKKEAYEAQMKVRDSLIKVLGQEKFDSLSNVRKSQGKF